MGFVIIITVDLLLVTVELICNRFFVHKCLITAFVSLQNTIYRHFISVLRQEAGFLVYQCYLTAIICTS